MICQTPFVVSPSALLGKLTAGFDRLRANGRKRIFVRITGEIVLHNEALEEDYSGMRRLDASHILFWRSLTASSVS